MELTPKQKKRIEKLSDLTKKGDVAILKYLFEIEELFDERLEEVKKFAKESSIDIDKVLESIKGKDGRNGLNGEKGDKGEKGETGNQGEKGIDGKDGRDGRDGRDGEDGKDGSNGKDGKDGSPDTAEQVRDKLETLDGDERLDKKAIKGLEDIEEKLKVLSVRKVESVGGLRGFELSVDSSAKGIIQYLNLIAGSNVTLTHTLVGQQNNVTISSTGGGGGGGSFTIEEPTGDVDDSNTEFVFTEQPLAVVVNGQTYRVDNGWSWNAGTLTATIAGPVGTDGDIYGMMSSSVTIEEPTGDVDDSNTDFVFVDKPLIIVVNGMSYRENHGWTWNSGTGTATISGPVGTDGDIYGIIT